MTWIARGAGLVLFALGAFSLFVVWVAQQVELPLPVLGDAAWTAELRRLADWVVYALITAGGAGMIVRWRAGVGVFAAALGIAAAKAAYDAAVGVNDVERYSELIGRDFYAIVLCVSGLLLSAIIRPGGAPFAD